MHFSEIFTSLFYYVLNRWKKSLSCPWSSCTLLICTQTALQVRYHTYISNQGTVHLETDTIVHTKLIYKRNMKKATQEVLKTCLEATTSWFFNWSSCRSSLPFPRWTQMFVEPQCELGNWAGIKNNNQTAPQFCLPLSPPPFSFTACPSPAAPVPVLGAAHRHKTQEQQSFFELQGNYSSTYT